MCTPACFRLFLCMTLTFFIYFIGQWVYFSVLNYTSWFLLQGVDPGYFFQGGPKYKIKIIRFRNGADYPDHIFLAGSATVRWFPFEQRLSLIVELLFIEFSDALLSLSAKYASNLVIGFLFLLTDMKCNNISNNKFLRVYHLLESKDLWFLRIQTIES